MLVELPVLFCCCFDVVFINIALSFCDNCRQMNAPSLKAMDGSAQILGCVYDVVGWSLILTFLGSGSCVSYHQSLCILVIE